MYVDTWNKEILEYPDYNPPFDRYFPGNADVWATFDGFPKVQCWNSGQSILVGVGAVPGSKIYFQFRVYNPETEEIQSTFNRMDHKDCRGKLLEAEFHKDDEDKLIFLMSEDGIILKIVEANMLENTAETISVIKCDSMMSLRIAEDLSTIYLIRRFDTTYSSTPV